MWLKSGVSACSECSPGFLLEDHPYEQDKASEACAGETVFRAACDVVPQAAVPCAECPVPFAGQLFSAASLHVPRRVQGLCFANPAEIPAAES